MRATSSTSNTHIWSSPIPYLFGGLAVMLILILVALIILACSYISGDTDAKPAKPAIPPLDLEPRIVVIMAGDKKPKYLAKPVTSLPSCCDKV
ncbi:hypothetical protein NL676_005335 [Syzygium grande]|nr:hypothetical protein NL676_005335 [Syzygium grande]